MRFKHFSLITVSLGVCLAVSACIDQPSPGAVQWSAVAETASPAISKAFPAVADQANLHNAHVVTAKVISGAQPEGNASFESLQALGVKIIISVDGATPDVERAKKFGMRYVHLPIGYDGVDPAEGKAIAKAIQELPGPIYVHCHHGKHRSAAAVAVACVYNGQLKPEQAESVLQTFGTGANYKGLWKAAREAKPLDDAELSALQVKYVEVAKIEDFAKTMVHIDEHWDHIKAIQKAGWKAPADHPDLDPAHEAKMLQELFHESARLELAGKRPADFHQKLTANEEAINTMAEVLAKHPVDAPAAQAAFERGAESCVSCHKSYRDDPASPAPR